MGMISTADELKDYKNMFIQLDTSKDGFLSPDELRNGIKMVVGNLLA
jgi:hypothetical protein